MKKSLLAVLMASGVGLLAQSPRLSLYEEFTGENCGPCAATNPGLNALLLTPANQQKIVAIKWQVPIPSAPSATWSLYKTNQAEIDWRHKGWNGAYSSTSINGPSVNGYGYPSVSGTSTTSGVNSAPSGRIDGQHQMVFGAASNHPANLTQNHINAAQSQTAAFTINMSRAWDATFSSVNLTVNIQATANFTAVGPLVFRTVMVERQISFDQAPGSNGEKFFEDVAIKSFPDLQNGTPMVSNWTTGQSMTFTLNAPLPSYVRDKSQIAFVGFIQDDGTRKVAQAARADVDLLANDAKALSAIVPAMTCSNSFVPIVSVENVGINAISNLTITPYINGVAQPDFYWTGNLAPTSSISIPMSNLSLPSGIVTFSYNISGVSGGDDNMLNNNKKGTVISIQNYLSSPVVEGFVSPTYPPANWAIIHNSGGSSWQRVTNTGGYGTSNNAVILNFYSTVEPGSAHHLLLPPMNFTTAYIPTISFDFAYTQYNNTYVDKLEVMVSNDCGNSWSTVWSAQGAQLSTTNGQYITSSWVPSSTQWSTAVVSLNGFQTSQVLVKFVGTSGYGNNLYLDNINLKEACATQTINLQSSSAKICAGQSATLNVTGASTYSWSENGQTGTSIVVTPSVTTSYTATSTDALACGNTGVITVSVGAVQNIAISEGRTSMCVGESNTLTASGANNYVWNNNSTGSSLIVEPTSPGTLDYTVTSTDPEGCGNAASISVEVLLCTGIKNNHNVNFSLFPNPSNGEFLLRGEFQTNTNFEVYNSLGQKVYTQALTAGDNPVKCKLAAGVYHFTLTEGDILAGQGNLIVR